VQGLDDTHAACELFREPLGQRQVERAVELGDTDANLEIAKIYIREKNQVVKAARHLRRVIKAKAGMDVTIASHEEAQRLLNKYSV